MDRGVLRHMAALRRNRKGTVTVLTALGMVSLLCLAGVTIDLGDAFDAHRALQGANDLAAVAAASDLNAASAAAVAAATANGYQQTAIASVTTGIYVPNPLIPVNQRFTPAPAASSNAALVTMSNPQQVFFNGAYNLAGQGGNTPPISNSLPIGTQSIAVNAVGASFTIGTQLANLNGGLINSVLGGLLGSNISLSVMDYNALLTTQIDLFQFSQALAAELQVTGLTYQQLFSSHVTLGQVVQALDSAGANGPAATALNEIAAAAGGSTQTLNLSQLINFGPFQYYQVGSPEVMSLDISAYQLLSLAGQLAGAGHLIALAVNANIPGISTVTGDLTIGEPPVGTTMITIGNTGTSVHTAQTRLYLSVGIGLLGAAQVNLPLYMELASGTASLSSMSCNVLDAPASSVTLAVSPSVASAWIGSVSPANMVNFSVEPTVSPAVLVNVASGLNLLTVDGYATASISNLKPTNVTFSYSDIQNNVMHATDTKDYVESLLSSLLGAPTLTASLLGLPVPVPPAVVSQLDALLVAAAAPVDQLVSGSLQTLGVSLGVADTWVNGEHCAPAMVAQ